MGVLGLRLTWPMASKPQQWAMPPKSPSEARRAQVWKWPADTVDPAGSLWKPAGGASKLVTVGCGSSSKACSPSSPWHTATSARARAARRVAAIIGPRLALGCNVVMQAKGAAIEVRVGPPKKHKMDFFAAAKDAMNAASEQASQRVAQAQAGKRLLDDGGPEMEQKIATKAHCRRTTNADTMAVATISDIAAQYEEAMQELTRALATSACTPEERYDFQQLLGLYETRLGDYRQAAQVLSAMPPPAPFVSGEEDDAIKILWARGKARTAQERAQAVSQQAMDAAQRS